MTHRFILRASADASPNCDALAAKVLEHTGLTVVDRSGRMLLIQGSDAALESVLQDTTGWTSLAEVSKPLPSLKPRLRKVAVG